MAYALPQPTPSSQAPGVLEQMSNARSTCRELLELLAAENAGLHQHRLSEVEARLNLKRRLTLRLELFLKEIKARKQEWAANPQAQNVALHLAQEIGAFQTLAATNMQLLQAAHQVRADMVAIIKDTIEARAPRVQTYGRSGGMAYAAAGQAMQVMRRDI